MAKSLMVRNFKWLEYTIAVLIAALLAWVLIWALDSIVPRIYDDLSESYFVDALKDAYDSGEITHAESREILQIHRNSQLRFKLDKWRIRLLFVLSIGISAAVTVLLFKKYRLLRFRERLSAEQ
jgi:ABC-type nickel/cobalt efflux system permease component RcnA